ncbi:hypothetical protein D3C76_1821110 [compost metagenome]
MLDLQANGDLVSVDRKDGQARRRGSNPGQTFGIGDFDGQSSRAHFAQANGVLTQPSQRLGIAAHQKEGV